MRTQQSPKDGASWCDNCDRDMVTKAGKHSKCSACRSTQSRQGKRMIYDKTDLIVDNSDPI